MKAITCTQCGATIEDVSERSTIIDCSYCGARIMLDARPPVAQAPPQVPTPDFETPSSNFSPVMLIGVVAGAFLLIPIFIMIVSVNKPTLPTPAKAYTAPASPSTYPTPSSWMTEALEKPVAVVNYQPRVSWDGPNDMEHFADPEVDLQSVSDLSTEEVKKTVFKNRVVKLRVVINTEGEIDEVETISGHPILVEAATASAKSSIFRSRSKPTTRILTYTFRLLAD